MSDTYNALQVLQEGILHAVDTRLEQAPFDKTFKGRIVSILPKNKYGVQINGNLYNVRSSTLHAIGDMVNIIIPQNNYSEMFILSESSSISGSNMTDRINSTIASNATSTIILTSIAIYFLAIQCTSTSEVIYYTIYSTSSSVGTVQINNGTISNVSVSYSSGNLVINNQKTSVINYSLKRVF